MRSRCAASTAWRAIGLQVAHYGRPISGTVSAPADNTYGNVMRVREDSNPLGNVRLISLLAHEVRHWFDSTGTLRGQRDPVRFSNAVHALLRNKEHELRLIKSYKDESYRLRIPDYYSVVKLTHHAPSAKSVAPVQPPCILNAIHVQKLAWTISPMSTAPNANSGLNPLPAETDNLAQGKIVTIPLAIDSAASKPLYPKLIAVGFAVLLFIGLIFTELLLFAIVASVALGFATYLALRKANSADRVKFVLGQHALTVEGDYFAERISLMDIDWSQSKPINLVQAKQYDLKWRTLGKATPGFYSGEYTLMNGDLATVFISDKSKVLYLKKKSGACVLLSVDNPGSALDIIRRQAQASGI